MKPTMENLLWLIETTVLTLENDKHLYEDSVYDLDTHKFISSETINKALINSGEEVWDLYKNLPQASHRKLLREHISNDFAKGGVDKPPYYRCSIKLEDICRECGTTLDWSWLEEKVLEHTNNVWFNRLSRESKEAYVSNLLNSQLTNKEKYGHISLPVSPKGSFKILGNSADSIIPDNINLEKPMNNFDIKSRKVQEVFGQNVTDASKANIISMIREAEEQKKQLGDLDQSSKYVSDKVKTLDAGIKLLYAELDK